MSRIVLELVSRAGWAPLLVFTTHVLVSRVLNAYVVFPPLDIPMHFFGGLAMAYFLARCYAALPEGIVAARGRAIVGLLLVTSATATTAVFWEFAEFIFDVVFDTHAQLGLADTLLDMALGIVGGVCWSTFALFSGRLSLLEPIAVRSSTGRERTG